MCQDPEQDTAESKTLGALSGGWWHLLGGGGLNRTPQWEEKRFWVEYSPPLLVSVAAWGPPSHSVFTLTTRICSTGGFWAHLRTPGYRWTGAPSQTPATGAGHAPNGPPCHGLWLHEESNHVEMRNDVIGRGARRFEFHRPMRSRPCRNDRDTSARRCRLTSGGAHKKGEGLLSDEWRYVIFGHI